MSFVWVQDTSAGAHIDSADIVEMRTNIDTTDTNKCITNYTGGGCSTNNSAQDSGANASQDGGANSPVDSGANSPVDSGANGTVNATEDTGVDNWHWGGANLFGG